MATPQQPKRLAAQRKSSGNNILSRMLQMEKQSRQQRASSASPTLPLSPRADYFSGPSAQASPSPTRSPRSPLPTPHSPLRPYPLLHSQTLPTLTSDAKLTERPSEKPRSLVGPLNISISRDSEESAAEVCLSPSWSDHGEKQRKREKRKAEKEQKEREKRLRQEDEKQKMSDVRQGKRLSKKPPPAAMETQKMPTALRRNSWISLLASPSSSGENTGSSSRDERRLSGISLGSIRSNRRSQSAPRASSEDIRRAANSPERGLPIVSPLAPKLPSFKWGSRRTSRGSDKSDVWGNEDAYERDLITFAYRLEASAVVSEPEKIEQPRAKQSSTYATQQQAPSTPTISTSSTEPTPGNIAQRPGPSNSPQRSPDTPRDYAEVKVVKEPNQSPNEQQSSTFNAKDSSRGLIGTTTEGMRSSSQNSPAPQSTPLPQVRSSYDGSSYVHKQRMYQQQLSIAGFEEQQAVKAANDLASDLAAQYEALLAEQPRTAPERGRTSTPTRPVELGVVHPVEAKRVRIDDSSISPTSIKQRHRSNSPRNESAPIKPHSRGPTTLSQYSNQTDDSEKEREEVRLHTSTQTVRDASLGKPQAPTGLKRDRILGFRRRAKEPPAFISVPCNSDNQVVAVQSAPLEAPPLEEPVVKRSKIERLFREPRPSFVEPSRTNRSSSFARDQTGEDDPQSKSSQGHSRTRTSSSTVLNDSISSPRLLAKSKTETVLSPAAESPKQPPLTKNASNTESKAHHKYETNPESTGQNCRSKHANFSQAFRRDGKSVSSVEPTSPTKKDTEPATSVVALSKRTKTSPAEVIVESKNADGLIRKASLIRPRSNPDLQTQTTATKSLPSLDFLPQLKHQPLVIRERQSPTRPAQDDSHSASVAQVSTTNSPLASQSPITNPPDLKLIPRSPLRPSQFPIPTAHRHNRSATDVGTISFGKGTLAEGLDAKPVAKLFVVCCKCKFWHDLPSKLYEAMALPKELHKADKGKLAGARLETAVRCPWCEHAMTTFCCQGWTTVVYLHERHH